MYVTGFEKTHLLWVRIECTYIIISLITVVLNNRDLEGIYGFLYLKNSLTIMFPSNIGNLCIGTKLLVP